MSRDEEALPVEPETIVAAVGVSAEPIASQTQSVVEAKKLAEALRQLQERIPDYAQLSTRESQAMLRVTSLDPAFIDGAIQAARVSTEARAFMRGDVEAFRREAESIRDWDEVHRELLILAKGIADANRKRRHRVGTIALHIYALLGDLLKRGSRTELRPYYEAMKNVYRRKKQPQEIDHPADP